MPKTTPEIRQAVASALTESFCNSTGHPSEIFGIRFFEYEAGQAAMDGKLLTAANDPPYIHFLLYCPRLKRSAKQALAKSMTDAFVTATQQPAWKPILHISEHPYDNIAVEGKLLSDAYKECAERPFYYPIPKD